MKKHLRHMDLGLGLARLTGFLSLVLGAIVLLGWYLHEPALIQVNPTFVPMQYNTALGFAVGGLALLGLAWYWPRFARITSVVVLLIGVLTLIEYIFGADLHIDQLFMEHYIDLKTSNPGRMAPNTALCFSLTGLTVLLTIVFHERPRITAWTATLGALIISLGVTALAGYMIGIEDAYGWGHMTRMAIHTAAGFIILGTGLVAHAWSRSRQLSPAKTLPHWMPQVIAITGLTFTFAMWQALSAHELRMVGEMGAGAANISDEGLLLFGVLLTFTLALKARAVTSKDRAGRWVGRIYAPYVAIALGALLSASLYSLLDTSFKASVKQRFDAAVLNHSEAIEHGIEAHLETLYHLRSGFDASSYVNRDEFRIFVRHSLKNYPGIKALEWVPLVTDINRQDMEAAARDDLGQGFVIRDNHISSKLTPALQRDVYFPIYYVEPLEPFLSVLGFDLGSRPDYRQTLMKAARGNIPVVSSRLQLIQSETGDYAVFVALPVYGKDMMLDSADERLHSLRGFAVLVTEIGPIISAILEESTRPAGLSLTFTDTEAGANKAFMHRHISRTLDPGLDDSETDYLGDSLKSTTTLAFADHNWQVTAHAANRKIYPDWNANNLWLPLGVLLLSFGLAYFLYRMKQVDAELTNSRMQMHAILEHSPAVIYLKDLDGRYLMVNRVWRTVTGIPEERAIGATYHDLQSPEIADEFVRDDRRVAETRTAMQSEENLPHPDGTVHTYMSYKFPVADENDKVFAIGGVSSDITDLKLLQTDLEQTRDVADAANQAKSAFLASMSHELRTPMNAILGYSEMLIEEAEDAEQEAFIPDLKKINQSGTHLLALINDVLDLSKIESGKMEVFPEDIKLDILIDEVAATAHPLLEKNSNKLAVERGKNLGNTFQDLTKLRQILFNLMSNAAKFTHKGTVTLQANRLTKGNGDWLTLAVSDTGIGIAKDKLDHVFAEFSQADNTTTRDYGGTGLGLAISRRYCGLIGGELSVHSELGEGSTFTVQIPADLPGSKAREQTATKPAELTGVVQESEQTITPGSTILVIDDDPEACELIERNLTKDGFSVVTATSGEQGLRMAHDIQPAAITLDVMMPGMDGWSVLRALKADPVLRHIPVIMLTMMDDRSRGYSLGAVDYLTKPVDREQLRKTLSPYYRDGKSSTVMLVEDDLEIRDMMARTLAKDGWGVSEAANGQEALDQLAVKLPDLILLDLMMPVMDGFGFLAEMRVRPDWQHIPVIVVTAMDLTPDDRQRLSGQVEQVLEKNAYTLEQLFEHVRDAVVACNVTRVASTEEQSRDGQDTAG
jgi:PAS domain S-box-containing protein